MASSQLENDLRSLQLNFSVLSVLDVQLEADEKCCKCKADAAALLHIHWQDAAKE